MDQGSATQLDQRHVWHKQLADWRPMVVMVNTPLPTPAVAPVVLCRSELARAEDPLMD